jgi:hypothetical protein
MKTTAILIDANGNFKRVLGLETSGTDSINYQFTKHGIKGDSIKWITDAEYDTICERERYKYACLKAAGGL